MQNTNACKTGLRKPITYTYTLHYLNVDRSIPMFLDQSTQFLRRTSQLYNYKLCPEQTLIDSLIERFVSVQQLNAIYTPVVIN